MRPNERGLCPPSARGKRVRVILRNGLQPVGDWAADGREACRWTLTGDAWDIVQWEKAT